MSRNVGLLVAWILAAILAIAAASAAVAGVRNQVTERPASVGAPAEALSTSESSSPTQPEEDEEPLSASATSTTSEAEAPQQPSTTTQPPDGTTPKTTLEEQASTTTEATPPSDYSKTYDTDGGSVRIRVSGDAVELVGAYPIAGWRVELENPGPEKVEIHFERDGEGDGDETHEIEFRASMDGGELKVQISTE